LQQQVLGFLISSTWVLGEASALGVKVSDEEVQEDYENRLGARVFLPAARASPYPLTDVSRGPQPIQRSLQREHDVHTSVHTQAKDGQIMRIQKARRPWI
jgi:hypothetical protein